MPVNPPPEIPLTDYCVAARVDYAVALRRGYRGEIPMRRNERGRWVVPQSAVDGVSGDPVSAAPRGAKCDR